MCHTEPLKGDPLHGLDSRWSWMTAASCSWMVFFATFSVRVSGILFYGIMETFRVTREQASWPVTLHSCFLHLGGPVMGLLCHRFSCRTVLLICSSLTGTAIAVCFFAEDVLFIKIFGVLHGFTLSGMLIGVNVVVAQHFEKRRNTAFGMLFTLSGLSTFVIPPVIEFFRITYGTRGTFLLLGALMFNTFPGAIIVRSPPWTKRNFNQSTDNFKSESNGCINSHVIQNKTEDGAVCPKTSFPGTIIATSLPEDLAEYSTEVKTPQERKYSVIGVDDLKNTLKNFLSILFWCDALSFATLIFSHTTFVLLSVDLSRDKGIPPHNAIYLLYALSAGDIALRALSGLAIDSAILTLEAVMALGYATQVLAFELLVWSSSMPMLLLSSVLVGIGNGSTVLLEAPVCVKDFGMDALPVMIGGISFCVGVGILGIPMLAGHYKDKLEEYDGLLHIVALANVLLFALWMLRLFNERQKRNKRLS
ncbi:unnamed protein product, partial [Ixodes hexagonus]